MLSKIAMQTYFHCKLVKKWPAYCSDLIPVLSQDHLEVNLSRQGDILIPKTTFRRWESHIYIVLGSLPFVIVMHIYKDPLWHIFLLFREAVALPDHIPLLLFLVLPTPNRTAGLTQPIQPTGDGSLGAQFSISTWHMSSTVSFCPRSCCRPFLVDEQRTDET